MKKEAFKTFIEDLCNQAEAQLDFSWRHAEDSSKPSQLVSQLLSLEEATALLTRLRDERSVIKFTIVESREFPGSNRLMVSTDSIKEINNFIANKLNARHPVPGYVWQESTSSGGESLVSIALDFSCGYSSKEGMEDTVIHLMRLKEQLESSYGISSLYEAHKHGDYFSLEDVSYTAYKTLFTVPSLIHALLNYSVLNRAEEEEEVPATVVSMLLS